MDEINQAIEAAKEELAMLQAEIATLKARKSIGECIREAFAQGQPISVLKRKTRRKAVEVTITEADFQRLKDKAQSAEWIERKLSELQRVGDRLWHKLNQAEALKAAIRRAEAAELRCRRLEYEMEQLRNQPPQVIDIDDGGDREIDYPELDDLDGREL